MKPIAVMLIIIIAMAMASRGEAVDDLTLSRKAEVFSHDLRERFVFDGQLAPKRRETASAPGHVYYNMPDNAYMTGIYVGTLAMQYAVTRDQAVRDEAGRALSALNLLCNVSGIPGLLARAAWPCDREFADDGDWQPGEESRYGGYKWRADVSSDQVDGVMFGYALAYDLVADKGEREVIAGNTAAIVDHILDHDLRIVDYDGAPTTWGRYYPSYVRGRENLNALLMLQHLKVASHVTGRERYDAEYRRLAFDEGYAELAVTARKMGDPLDPDAVNHSDDVLMMLAYYPLLEYENDPRLVALYKQSLTRTWLGADGYPGIEPEANPLFALTVHKFLGDSTGVLAAVETLRLFPLDMKWNKDTIERYGRRFAFSFEPRSISPEPKPGRAVPIDRRPGSWSAWVHTPYEAGPRRLDSEWEYNGHDYLLAYWMCRHNGVISAEE